MLAFQKWHTASTVTAYSQHFAGIQPAKRQLTASNLVANSHHSDSDQPSLKIADSASQSLKSTKTSLTFKGFHGHVSEQCSRGYHDIS
jgi:hypothetical protein